MKYFRRSTAVGGLALAALFFSTETAAAAGPAKTGSARTQSGATPRSRRADPYRADGGRRAVEPPSDYAAFVLGEIARSTGLDFAPAIYRAPVDSARAVMLDGREAILYNPSFLDDVNREAGTDWAAVSVIAHELGHHFYGHVHGGIEGVAPDTLRAHELEADYFSGFVLARMGATLADAEAAQQALYDDSPSETHPDSRDRLRFILTGWADGRGDEPLAGAPLLRARAVARNAVSAFADDSGSAMPDDDFPEGNW